MASAQIVDSLLARIAHPAPAGTAVYAILDAARDDRIRPLIAGSRLPHACLFAGVDGSPLQAVAPYLVALDPEVAGARGLLELGWGESWGVLVRTRATLPELRRHLRTLLRVVGPDRRVLYFRYYDPRVLRTYLPTCNSSELRQVFGPIDGFDMEAAGAGELVSFDLSVSLDGRLSVAAATIVLTAAAGDGLVPPAGPRPADLHEQT